jgi:hypothetical protein
MIIISMLEYTFGEFQKNTKHALKTGHPELVEG